VGIGHRGKGRREKLLSDAAEAFVAASSFRRTPLPPMSTVIIRSRAGKITLRGMYPSVSGVSVNQRT
jgi:hypothetical protein